MRYRQRRRRGSAQAAPPPCHDVTSVTAVMSAASIELPRAAVAVGYGDSAQSTDGDGMRWWCVPFLH